MTLTEEQRAVVELDGGRHLVLAPPGSGKTEMLTQRVLRAVKGGVAPARMLCATFTNRAAFEMRDRVTREGEAMALPEVGNLHHFCHRFLISVGRLNPRKHVLDEVEQIDFVREVVDVLREELREGPSADLRRAHGVSVLRNIRGMLREGGGAVCEARREYLHGLMEDYFAECHKNGNSPYPPFLSAALISHQRRIGIPNRFLRRTDEKMRRFDCEGVVRAIERAYTGLKRKFNSVDFDDLLNEAYLYLEAHPLDDARRFAWVQIDEVQDLNPIQWRIVRALTAKRATSVYFGDLEQAIFSFLGASETHFAEAVRGCEKHFFRTNFRSTPLLLEVLMRYSLDTLRSDWDFLPAPSDAGRRNGELTLRFGRHEEAMARVRELLDGGTAENVALLVRRNQEADQLEGLVRGTGYRYAKVSGVDVFSTALMRDFMAFASLFAPLTSRTAWAALALRFADGVWSAVQARYFVREMFAAGFDPRDLFEMTHPIPRMLHPGRRASRWAWMNRRVLTSLRRAVNTAYAWVARRRQRHLAFADVFEVFAEMVFVHGKPYTLHALWPERFGPKDEATPELYAAAKAHAMERIGKFVRYADRTYRDDARPFERLLAEDWDRLSKLKEADLLVGDEKVIISTVHKAKGRQFDAVVIPSANDILHGFGSDREELARLMYVAMSRAKRHLSIFTDSETPELEMVRPCFDSGYDGYYARKARGEDVSGDWLHTWEALAAHNRARECPEAYLAPCLASKKEPVVRMALKVLRHHADSAVRRQWYLDAFDLCRCTDALIDCLRECRIYDDETLACVRGKSLEEAANHHVRMAAFRYFASALQAQINKTTADCRELRMRLMACVGDFVYSIDPNLRVEAATLLFDAGDSRFISKVSGYWSDFEQLALINDCDHDDTLRTLKNARASDLYCEALGKILLAHSNSF